MTHQSSSSVQSKNADFLINRAKDNRDSHESGKSRTTAIVWGVILAVAGAILTIAMYANLADTSAPSCNGQTMSPGDTCEIIGGGSSGDYSYSQMISRRHGDYVWWMVVGIVVLVIAVIILIRAMTALNPAQPWGKAVASACPRCGQSSLREKHTSYSVSRGRRRTTWSANVTLCTPQCGYTAASKP